MKKNLLQSVSSVQLQLAPTIRHQALAMMSLLHRYDWHSFTVVTSRIGGHTSFAQVTIASTLLYYFLKKHPYNK